MTKSVVFICCVLPPRYVGRSIEPAMHDLSDEEQRQVLGEVLMDELKAIREGIGNLPTRPEFNVLKDDVAELKSDMKIVKAVVTDQSKQLADHEEQLAHLRNAA